MRSRNHNEVDRDDQGKRGLWIGSNFNLLFSIVIVIVSFLATRRLLVRVSLLPMFYIFSHPLTASLLKLGIPFSLIVGGALLFGGLGLFFLTSFLYRDRIPAAAATLFYFFLIPLGTASPFAERIFSGGGEVVLSLGFFYVLLGVSEIFLGGGKVKLGRIVMAIVGSSLLISFWYHPGFVFGRFRMWRELGVLGSMFDIVPIGMVSVPVLGTITFLLFDRRDELQAVFVSLFVLAVCLFIYVSGNTFGKDFIPNPYRFALIAAVPFALVFGIIFSHLLRFFDLFKDRMRFKLPVSYSAVFTGLVFAILIVLNFPGGGKAAADVSEGGWFWLSTGRADFRFFAGVLISLLTVVFMVVVARRTWPKDSYLDRVFSPRGAYED